MAIPSNELTGSKTFAGFDRGSKRSGILLYPPLRLVIPPVHRGRARASGRVAVASQTQPDNGHRYCFTS